MFIDVSTSVLIQRALTDVATFAANPLNSPTWYVNIFSAKYVEPTCLQVGARVAFSARFLGRELAYVYEVLEFEPDKRLVMATADGPFPMETTYVWESTSEGATRMTLRNRGYPQGFGALLAPILRVAVGRANRNDLRRLKQLLESEPG